MPLNDLIYYLVFLLLSAVTLIAGLLVVTLRNVVHSALALVGAFFGVAGLYLLLEAEFLAVVQVLIYVGAISVLILFAIMLTRGLMTSVQTGVNNQWAAAALISHLPVHGYAARGRTGSVADSHASHYDRPHSPTWHAACDHLRPAVRSCVTLAIGRARRRFAHRTRLNDNLQWPMTNEQ